MATDETSPLEQSNGSGAAKGSSDKGAQIADSLPQVHEPSGSDVRARHAELLSDNFERHTSGELHDGVRTRDADMVGIVEDLERRQRKKELKRLRRLNEGGILRRMARKIVRF